MLTVRLTVPGLGGGTTVGGLPQVAATTARMTIATAAPVERAERVLTSGLLGYANVSVRKAESRATGLGWTPRRVPGETTS